MLMFIAIHNFLMFLRQGYVGLPFFFLFVVVVFFPFYSRILLAIYAKRSSSRKDHRRLLCLSDDIPSTSTII